jgi:hypothetical protein
VVSDDGYRVSGGPGPTVADLEELAHACRVLEGAADRLDAATWALGRAGVHCSALSRANPHAAAAQGALSTARDRHQRAATDLRSLARGLHRTVEYYTDAESTAGRGLRAVLAASAGELGEHPLLAGLAGGAAAAAAGMGLLVVGPALAQRELASRIMSRPGPLTTGARDLPGWATADGRAETAMLAAAAFVRALPPGRQPPVLHPVASVSAELDALLSPAGATVVIPRDRPPQLPAPRTTADVLANVALSYDDSMPSGLPGTPEGTISVQRLTHPDGARAWVVEIPGTQEWRRNANTPMDLTTNMRLLAGLPDDMTDAVLESMAAAGIAPDEPVLLAGHSQGGMVAVSVAAMAGTAYSVRAVVTAGSPDTPRAAPPGIAVRHYRHDEDGVPQLDGAPSRTNQDVTVVRRNLSTREIPTPIEAHDIQRYIETAASDALAGNPSMKPFDDAVATVLGPPGTTAVTQQFQATRDPAVVAITPPTLGQG